jgi:hypothetical protein
MGCITCINDSSTIKFVKKTSLTTSKFFQDDSVNITNVLCSNNNISNISVSIKHQPSQDNDDKNNSTNINTLVSSPSLFLIKSQNSILHKLSSYDNENENDNGNDNNDNDVTSPYSIIKQPSSFTSSKVFISFYKSSIYLDNQNPIPFDQVTLYKNTMIDSKGKVITKEKDKLIFFEFGNEQNDLDKNENNNIDNEHNEIDYNIEDETITNHQFNICYMSKSGMFYLNDIPSGNGVFYKLQQKIQLPKKGRIILTFSNIYYKIKTEDIDNINNNYKNKVSKITITCIKKDSIIKKYVFNSAGVQYFKMGRSVDCDVMIDNKEVSRVQLTFIYQDNIWNIYEGLFDNILNKHIPSTNGTWIQIEDSIRLIDGLILKTGQIIMEIKTEDEH